MAQAVNERQAAALLAQSDRILILCHQKPDGDTLGSGFALLYALLAMGKTARIACPDGFLRAIASSIRALSLKGSPTLRRRALSRSMWPTCSCSARGPAA